MVNHYMEIMKLEIEVDLIYIETFDTLKSRLILGTFAKWCSKRDIDWEIDIYGN